MIRLPDRQRGCTMDIKVNRLPDLTWNRLDMNYGVIRDADKKLKPSAQIATSYSTLPEGVSHRTILADEAERLLESTPAQPEEHIVAGKVPIYHAQRFATGLGRDYDELISSQVENVELLEVRPGARTKTPVLWHVELFSDSRAVTQQIIHVGAGASLTLIMDYVSGRKDGGYAGISTKVILEDGAALNLSKIQMLGNGYLHTDDLGISLGNRAEMTLNQMELGGQNVYAGVQAEQIGDRSVFTSRLAYLARRNGTMDITYNAVQRGKKTRSDMNFDGVLYDSARKIWRGTIDFRCGSSGSVGHENENILMLSDDAENKSMPLILCEEEDVEGQHGSTIGRLADDILFYFGTRGIDERTAEQVMVDARIGTVTREIPDAEVRGRIEAFLKETV